MSTRSLNSLESVDSATKSRKHVLVLAAASGFLVAGLAILITGCALWIRVLIILGPIVILGSVASYVYGYYLYRKSSNIDPGYVEPRRGYVPEGPPRTLCVMSLDSSLSLAQSLSDKASHAHYPPVL